MKTFSLFALMILTFYCSTAQSIDYDRNRINSILAQQNQPRTVIFFPIRYRSMWYPPKKVQGLHMISVNRRNTGMDDVYFIDKKGNTHYHTIKPTAPVNLYMQRSDRHYDSFNPHGSRNFNEAIGNGLSAVISGLMFKE